MRGHQNSSLPLYYGKDSASPPSYWIWVAQPHIQQCLWRGWGSSETVIFAQDFFFLSLTTRNSPVLSSILGVWGKEMGAQVWLSESQCHHGWTLCPCSSGPLHREGDCYCSCCCRNLRDSSSKSSGSNISFSNSCAGKSFLLPLLPSLHWPAYHPQPQVLNDFSTSLPESTAISK